MRLSYSATEAYMTCNKKFLLQYRLMIKPKIIDHIKKSGIDLHKIIKLIHLSVDEKDFCRLILLEVSEKDFYTTGAYDTFVSACIMFYVLYTKRFKRLKFVSVEEKIIFDDKNIAMIPDAICMLGDKKYVLEIKSSDREIRMCDQAMFYCGQLDCDGIILRVVKKTLLKQKQSETYFQYIQRIFEKYVECQEMLSESVSDVSSDSELFRSVNDSILSKMEEIRGKCKICNSCESQEDKMKCILCKNFPRNTFVCKRANCTYYDLCSRPEVGSVYYTGAEELSDVDRLFPDEEEL